MIRRCISACEAGGASERVLYFILFYFCTTTETTGNLRCLSWLYRAYSILFNLYNVVEFFWLSFLKDFIEVEGKKESRCLTLTSSTKRDSRHFPVIVVQCRQRNVQKSAMHVHSYCFSNQTFCFFAVLVAVAAVVAYAPY